MTAGISYQLRQQIKAQILTLLSSKGQNSYFKNLAKMRMSEKYCKHNNNSDNPLTSPRTNGGKKRLGFLG